MVFFDQNHLAAGWRGGAKAPQGKREDARNREREDARTSGWCKEKERMQGIGKGQDARNRMQGKGNERMQGIGKGKDARTRKRRRCKD